jgi:fructose-specific phosphotransferase system IIA component
MKIGDYLKEERMLLDLKAQEKEGAIRELSVVLKDSREVIDFDTFLKDILERERLCTTGIGKAIGLPHARTDAVKDFIIAFGRSKEGIRFNSLDGKRVKLIFLMGTPKSRQLSVYLKALAHLSRLLQKEYFRESLLSAATSSEIIDIFKKEEK